MAERIWEYLQGFSAILSDIVIGCLTLALVPMAVNMEVGIATHLWILCAAVQLLVSMCMISAGTSWSVYLAFQGAAIVAGCIFTACGSFFSAYRPDMVMILCFLVIAVGSHGALAAYRLPGANGIMRYVDVLVCMTAFYLYGTFQTGIPESRELLALVPGVMALDLLMVNHLRTGGESASVIRGAGVGSRLALLGILVVCVMITGGLVGIASGQVHSAVDFLLVVLMGIYRVLAVIFGLIGRVLAFILLFLIALLPIAPKRAQENAAMRVEEELEEVLGETASQIPAWILAMVCAGLLLAAVIWLLYQLRNVRIQRIAPPRRRKRAVRQSHLWVAFKTLFRRLRDGMIFEWEYFCYRKTPQGLLVLAERIGKQKKLVRRPEESPGAYIRRFDQELRSRNTANETMGGAMELAGLARLLDQIFYAGKTEIPEDFDYQACAQRLRSLE